jgi:hypothetical protein
MKKSFGKIMESHLVGVIQNLIEEESTIKFKKDDLGGYHGTHKGVPIRVWGTAHHTDTSRPASKRHGQATFVSSRRDKTWNWKAGDGISYNHKADGFGSKKEAVTHLVDIAKRKQGPWAEKK